MNSRKRLGTHTAHAEGQYNRRSHRYAPALPNISLGEDFTLPLLLREENTQEGAEWLKYCHSSVRLQQEALIVPSVNAAAQPAEVENCLSPGAS